MTSASISGATFVRYSPSKDSRNGAPPFQATGRTASRSKASCSASRSTGSISVLTMNQATGLRSMPTTRHPSRSASTTVVPPPMNGSSTTLPAVSGSSPWLR